MDKQPGRFTIDSSNTMRVGTEIYRELVKKMLSVHIATMERKLRACQQCPPRCPILPEQELVKNPYTAAFRKLPFRPRKLLPTYLQQKLSHAEKSSKLTQERERKIRITAEKAEERLRKLNGNVAKLEEEEKQMMLILKAKLNALKDRKTLADRMDRTVETLRPLELDEAEEEEEEEEEEEGEPEAEAEEEPVTEEPETEPQDIGSPTPVVTIESAAAAADPKTPETGRSRSRAIAQDQDGPDAVDASAAYSKARQQRFRDIVGRPTEPLEFDSEVVDPKDIQDAGAEDAGAEADAQIADYEAELADLDQPDDDAKQETVEHPLVDLTFDEVDEVTKQDELVALFAEKLTLSDLEVEQRKTKRDAWKKSYSTLVGKQASDNPEFPEWFNNVLFQKGRWKKRKAFVAKLVGNPNREGLPGWQAHIRDVLAEPQHAWIFADAGQQPTPRKQRKQSKNQSKGPKSARGTRLFLRKSWERIGKTGPTPPPSPGHPSIL